MSKVPETSQGRLWLVATPIGNLQDISLRALEIIRTSDQLLCEDTRHSRRLLDAHGIAQSATSYGAHNLYSKLPWILHQLAAGRQVAYICDAGIPGISDPGVVLVSAAIESGHEVSAVPGANAALMALVLSGLPTDRFVFEGFLPHKKGRQTRLRVLAEEPRTIVLYESPHRLLKTLGELLEVLGDRRAVVARELTKVYEEVRRDSLSGLINRFQSHSPKGEMVIVIAGKSYKWKTDNEET